MKNVIMVLCALLALGLFPVSAQSANTGEPSVYVDYEYGDLKEVIVGLPYGMSPSLEAKWFADALKVLPKDEADYARKTAGMLWTEMINPETGKSETQMLEEENQAFIAILKSLGVKVFRPTEITVDFIKQYYGADVLLNGFSQDFPRDNMAVIGSNVIEFNLRTPIRKVDISGFRDILSEKCSDATVKWFSMPHTELLKPARKDTPFLEGGDVIVLGKTVLVGNTLNPSVGSNEAGYQWLKNILGDQYKVKRVRLVESVLHLDCVLSVPRRGLAIICEEAFVDGLPKELKGWDLIRVSLADVQRLAVNGVPVNSQNYILSYNRHNDNRTIQAELEKRGIKVHRVFFGTHNGQGGSLRCATQPLKRKVKMTKAHESQRK
ncbi:MAG: Inosamine-phosphate amidinotransferase 1 [Deltaproteobacteria bacterium ADurb.Bin151]|nr:MAG: Inosamine-phosphate amidinotransferase 1 [Deltaproteobacteria bacterium ADurb.Bin151]HQP26015.1 arginine deiminase-related protein [Smithellaceae bacterium]